MLKRGKLRQSLWVAVLLLFGLSGFSAFAAHKGKDLAGTTLPGFKLGGTTSSEVQAYLGLKNSDPFVLSDISAKVICVEVFGVFCPACHKNAPVVNRLYNVINDDPEMKNDVKIIGIAAGGKPKELDAYKKKFRVAFPLFPDPLGATWQLMGKPGTPSMFVCASRGKVLNVHTGIIKDLDSFLGEIRELRDKS